MLLRDWEDIHGTAFPYGSIFVASYTGTTNDIDYVGSTVIAAPAPGPNPYAIDAIIDGQGYLRFYSALDEQSNMLIETFDPRGIYPGQFFVDKDTELTDIDMTIYVNIEGGGMVIDIQPPVDGNPDPEPETDNPDSDVYSHSNNSDPCPPSSNGSSNGGSSEGGYYGGGSGGSYGHSNGNGSSNGGANYGHGMTPQEDFCDIPTSEPETPEDTEGTDGPEDPNSDTDLDTCVQRISGLFSLNTPNYNGETAVVMVTDLEGNGPFYVAQAELSPTLIGAEGYYSLEICDELGEMNVIGAYDSNNNGLIDPADTYGAYVSEPDVNGNPLFIGGETLSNHYVQVPLGSGSSAESSDSGLNIVPISWFNGIIMPEQGGLRDYPSGSTLYVAALLQEPFIDMPISLIESDSYAYETFEWSDISNLTAIPYSLGLPTGIEIYLWAFVDTDGDGLVNETMEPIAPASSDAIEVNGSAVHDLTLIIQP
jgi:hypothetical protein